MLSFLNREAHMRLPQNDEDVPDENPLLHPTANSHTERSNRDLKIVVKSFLLSAVIFLLVGVGIIAGLPDVMVVRDLDALCMDHVSQYSPVVRDVKPGWHTQRFNGSFLHQNVYRQDAGPEVDAAWQALGVDYRSVVVPLEEAEETGLRHDQVKISKTYGGGFPANVEGLHHLHCLDLLRKSLHWNYDYYRAKGEGAFTNSEYIVRVHVTHCLDMLRQVLMCNPDVGVLGQIWWQAPDESKPTAFVDFNTQHRCRDYEEVRSWAEAHQLPPEEEVDMSKFYEMPKPGDKIYDSIP